MSAEGESLGKSTYDLDVDITKFSRNMDVAKGQTSEMDDAMDALAAVARVAEIQLNRVKMDAAAGAQSSAIADQIERSIGNVGAAAMEASEHLSKVKLGATQAAESKASAEEISEGLDQISRNADQASRNLDKVKISQSLGSKQIGGTSVGLLGAGIGAATVLAPAAGPAVLGLLATLPVALAGVGGVVGTLALAFSGLSSAIEGNKKAYDKLNPTQQQFVTTVRSMEGELNNLKQVASTNLLPGLTDALHSALSPGTLDAVTTAVGEFATAIGHAGAEWGQYFGSSEFQSIFGPLMQDAAQNLGLLSTAALHLFDAVGVLGVAGIPFTNWVTQAIAKGSQLADTWVKGEQASGGLASAMSQAEISLRLVAQLLESAGNAVGALGQALYPVSKTAVKDLTDGLNDLAGIIHQNQAGIQNFVGGAVAALSSSLHIATPIVVDLAHELGVVASNIGGWKTAFELVLTGVLANKVIDLYKSVETLATKFGLVAPAAAKAATETEASEAGIGKAAAGAEGEVLSLRSTLLGMAGMVVGVAIALSLIPPSGVGQNELDQVGMGWLGKIPIAGGALSQGFKYEVAGLHAVGLAGGVSSATAPAGTINLGNADTIPSLNPATHPNGIGATISTKPVVRTTSSATPTGGAFGSSPAFTSGTGGSAASKAAASLTASLATDRSKLTTLSKQIATDATSGLIPDSLISGLQARATSLLQAIADGTKKSLPSITQSLAQLKSQIQEGLAQAVDDKKVVTLGKQLQDDLDNKLITQSQFTTLGTQLGKLNDELTSGLLSPEARRQVEANIAALKKQLALDLNLASEQKTLNSSVAELNQAVTARLFPSSVTSTAKSLAKQVGDDIAEGTKAGEVAAKAAQKQLASTIKQGVADIAKGLSIPAGLRSTETGLTSGLTGLNDNAGVLVGLGLDNIRLSIQNNLTQQATTLEAEVAVLKQQEATTTGALKTAVAAELTKVKAQLTSVQSQIVNNLQATVQTLQSKVSTLLSSVTSEFDSTFETATQSMLDAVGVTDYQNGAQTPLEAQLAAMQAQDTVTSLNAALTQAQATLATDQADPTVTAAQIAQDQEAVTQAQRAIDENNLSIKATAERALADSDYAAQVKKITADRTASEDAMNKSLADLSDSFENGTGSMSDLNAIAAAYGIQIGTSTIPDFTNLSTATGNLSTAFAALTTYISQVTNTPNASSTPAAIGNANVPGLGDVYIAPGYSLIYENGQPFVIANSLLSTVAGNLGSGYSTTPTGTAGKKPLMADGGIVRRTPGGIDVTVGEGRVDEAIVPLSADPRTNGTLSGGDIHFHGGTFIGGTKQQVAKDLKPYLDRVR